MQTEEIRALIAKERTEADKTHPLFVDNHQAYAVILEEMEETEEVFTASLETLTYMWNCVKMDLPIELEAINIKQQMVEVAAEAIQVAAMCQKAIDSEQNRKQPEVEEPEQNTRNMFKWMYYGFNAVYGVDVWRCSQCGYFLNPKKYKEKLPDVCPSCKAIKEESCTK